MTRLLEVTLPDYHKTSVKPQNFQALCDMVNWEALGPGPQALWNLQSQDRYSGEILKEVWTKNIVTDTGATAMLKNTWANAGSTVAIMNQIAISAQQGSTTLTTALAANATTQTTLAVQATPAAIANGVTLTLGFGGAAPQNVVINGAVSSGATSITVVSFTVNSTGFAIGAAVVPVPTTSDNPSSVTGAQYSGVIVSGGFTYSGTGAGNRQVAIAFTFLGGSYSAQNVTEAYTCNAGTIVAGSTASHLITTPLTLNTSTNLVVTINEKV